MAGGGAGVEPSRAMRRAPAVALGFGFSGGVGKERERWMRRWERGSPGAAGGGGGWIWCWWS